MTAVGTFGLAETGKFEIRSDSDSPRDCVVIREAATQFDRDRPQIHPDMDLKPLAMLFKYGIPVHLT